MPVKKHHDFGMSRFAPWFECVQYDSEENNVVAKVGTKAHEELERLLCGKGFSEEVLDDYVKKGIEWAFEEIMSIANGKDVHSEDMVSIGIETTGKTSSLVGIFGTVDAWFVDEGGVVHVIDFKSLARSSSGRNYYPQLLGYAIGVCDKLGIKNRNQEVMLHILYGGDLRREFKLYTLQEALVICESIVSQRINKEMFPPTKCQWCKYCKHVSECTAINKELAVATNEQALSKLSPPELLSYIEQIEQIIKRLKEQAKQAIANTPSKMMEANGVAYAIKEVSGKSSIKDGQLLPLVNAVQSFGIPSEDCLNVASVSKTAMSKLMKKYGVKSDVISETLAPFFEASVVTRIERLK